MKLPLALFVLLIAAFIGGGLFWYSAIFKEQKPELTTSDTASSKMCSGFAQAPGEISCDEAIRIAQAKYNGKVQSLSRGTMGGKEGSKDMWRIDLLLDEAVTKGQEVFNGARIYLDRKTGEELAGGYTKKQ